MFSARLHLSVLTIAMGLAVAGCGSSDAPTDGGPGDTAGSSNATHGGGATGTAGQSGGGRSAGGGATGASGAFGAAGGVSTGGSLGAGGAGPGGGGRGGGNSFGGTSAGGTHAGGAGAGGTHAGGPNAGSGNAGGAAEEVDCSAMMPTGGMTYSGTNVNGNADGLGYGIWTSGSGGSITVFKNAHAFSASWNNSQDFLAHVGLDFNSSKAYTAYGTIIAQYVEKKSGTAGGFSSIGIYGWTHSPCVEWYINEDAFNGLGQRGNVSATIDGGTYSLAMLTTTGTGGANACESGHSGGWTQMISTRKTARQCGTVTVSDHFAAWAKQGWSLGTLSSVHINVEVGGGQGSIDFPVANVTTSSK